MTVPVIRACHLHIYKQVVLGGNGESDYIAHPGLRLGPKIGYSHTASLCPASLDVGQMEAGKSNPNA